MYEEKIQSPKNKKIGHIKIEKRKRACYETGLRVEAEEKKPNLQKKIGHGVLKGKSNNRIGKKKEILMDSVMVMDSNFQTWRERWMYYIIWEVKSQIKRDALLYRK
jgi:hypothetical protein